jgi:hypothetical protein
MISVQFQIATFPGPCESLNRCTPSERRAWRGTLEQQVQPRLVPDEGQNRTATSDNQRERGQSERPLHHARWGGSGVYPKFGAGETIGVHLSKCDSESLAGYQCVKIFPEAAANRNSKNISSLVSLPFFHRIRRVTPDGLEGFDDRSGQTRRKCGTVRSVAEENAGSHQNQLTFFPSP